MTKQWNMNRVHKWAAVAVGLLLLVWTGSAMALLFPGLTANGIARPGPDGPIDVSTITVSPADAMAAVTQAIGAADRAWEVRLIRVGPRVLYEVRTVEHGVKLFDVEARTVIEIDETVAEEFARAWMAPEFSVVEVDRIGDYDLWYLGGALPTFRVTFDNGTRVHVDPRSGTVQLTDWQIQVVRVAGELHTLGLLANLFRVPGTLPLMWIGCFVLLLVIGTGYWLSLPARLRRRRVKATA